MHRGFNILQRIGTAYAMEQLETFGAASLIISQLDSWLNPVVEVGSNGQAANRSKTVGYISYVLRYSKEFHPNDDGRIAARCDWMR
jgi:hypothetical protein